MYKYDQIDKSLASQRVTQFREQVKRRINNQISEDEFRILRLQNGLYMQKHAYMFRLAIPYGLLSSAQLNNLADIADRYDRGYGHFTTRQNIQFNWIKLEDTPDILAMLAEFEMHGNQTSGNCVRNITADPFAGVAADEIVDSRPYCEWLRQCYTFHPEFLYLPRKFKIAINGASIDRAVIAAHDIGINLKKINNEVVADIWVGGGMGRTPIIGKLIRSALAWKYMPDYIMAILRVYNLHGRRDNIFKARIKILVNALGADEFTKQVDAEFEKINQYGLNQTLSEEEINRIFKYFQIKSNQPANAFTEDDYRKEINDEKIFSKFARWLKTNTKSHRQYGYKSVILSLKPHQGSAPGDLTSSQMREVANLADKYSGGEIRVTHEQNLVFADIRESDLYTIWQKLSVINLANPNIGLLTDIIACPGGDFCSLANARSIPIAASISEKFDNLDYLFDIGDISINISGCINSCGHHHVGNIGILGIDKDEQEFYQISLGGAQGNNTQIGKIIGPAFSAKEVPEVIQKIINVYLDQRISENIDKFAESNIQETFIKTVERIGIQPFKEAVYG